MNAKKIKLCPKCGGQGKTIPYIRNGLHWGYYVMCEDCGISTYVSADENTVIDDWNARYVIKVR